LDKQTLISKEPAGAPVLNKRISLSAKEFPKGRLAIFKEALPS
jgi:hypothetical protein